MHVERVVHGVVASISLSSRIFTRSPTRKRPSIAAFSAPVWRSMSFQRMFDGVVMRLTATMSSSHSMPPAVPWAWPAAASPWAPAPASAWPPALPASPPASATSFDGMSFIPQVGQWPGSSLTTSGCIGHV